VVEHQFIKVGWMQQVTSGFREQDAAEGSRLNNDLPGTTCSGSITCVTRFMALKSYVNGISVCHTDLARASQQLLLLAAILPMF
jgi:hypothetical protein